MNSSRSTEDQQALHRKRLCQILRHIASMHQSLNDEGSSLFVQDVIRGGYQASDFFQREDEQLERSGGVLFSTADFRHLLGLESNELASCLLRPSPFSFYAAASANAASSNTTTNTTSSNRKKRTFAGAFKESLMNAATNMSSVVPDKICWLRITRLSQAQLAGPDTAYYLNLPSVQRYIQDWRQKVGVQTTDDLLQSLTHILAAPKLAPTLDVRSRQDVKIFLRKHKKLLVRKTYQHTLEPIYNRLFEWIQQQNDHQFELVWGLGHARMLIQDEDDDGGQRRLINGPLLEVLMEVELARDGALLVRPRDHTGVTLNRQVATALSQECRPAVLSRLHQTVAELEPTQLSPGQPNTYISLLKRMAVELSAGGSFQHSSAEAVPLEMGKLIVTEAWCLFARPKPSSVWARDANALADQLQTGMDIQLPMAARALTLGPSSLDQSILGESNVPDGGEKSKFWSWISDKLSAKPPYMSDSKTRPLFPLPTSDAQNRIADLLLNQNCPAVVCEGPPGTGMF